MFFCKFLPFSSGSTGSNELRPCARGHCIPSLTLLDSPGINIPEQFTDDHELVQSFIKLRSACSIILTDYSASETGKRKSRDCRVESHIPSEIQTRSSSKTMSCKTVVANVVDNSETVNASKSFNSKIVEVGASNPVLTVVASLVPEGSDCTGGRSDCTGGIQSIPEFSGSSSISSKSLIQAKPKSKSIQEQPVRPRLSYELCDNDHKGFSVGRSVSRRIAKMPKRQPTVRSRISRYGFENGF